MSSQVWTESNRGSEAYGSGHAWLVSVAFHVMVIGLVFGLISLGKSSSEKIEIQVIDNPQVAPPAVDLTQQKPVKPMPVTPPQHKVFGISRKALTADAGGESVNVKQGNTVAKEQDTEKLALDDPDSLPIPAEEYLVTSMPALLAEMRVAYPQEAKAAGVEGPVVMELLIDASGAIRSAIVISGPGKGLNEAALAAVKLCKFTPAKIGTKAVAIKTRLTYRFVLDR